MNISGTHDLDRFMQHARSRVPAKKVAMANCALSQNERTLAVLSCCYSSRRGCVLSNMVRMPLNLQVHSPAHAQNSPLHLRTYALMLLPRISSPGSSRPAGQRSQKETLANLPPPHLIVAIEHRPARIGIQESHGLLMRREGA